VVPFTSPQTDLQVGKRTALDGQVSKSGRGRLSSILKRLQCWHQKRRLHCLLKRRVTALLDRTPWSRVDNVLRTSIDCASLLGLRQKNRLGNNMLTCIDGTPLLSLCVLNLMDDVLETSIDDFASCYYLW
jgi:hypothetical protein